MIPAIEIINLNYAYRSDWLLKRVPNLHAVNLNVNAGEAFGFLGHNGAGKTTTIKCLLNLVWPKSGTIRIFGKDSRTLESRQLVGYLPEQPYFYDHLSVYETLEMYAALSGVLKADLKTSCQAALERVGLQDRSKSRLRSLSKGLTQRLALAQAIVAKPKLLILDEPFSGLDPLGRKEFSDIFSELKKSGTTLFMSSHILSDVQALCDRFSIMVKGRLQGVFAMSEVANLIPGYYELALQCVDAGILAKLPVAQETTALGNLSSLKYIAVNDAKKALELAVGLQIPVESYRFVHGGLEELFVKLVKAGSIEKITA